MEVLAKKEFDLIAPYGGELVNLVVEEEKRARLIAHANTLSSIQLTARSLCDIELLATGAFSPLAAFMGKADYDRVLFLERVAHPKVELVQAKQLYDRSSYHSFSGLVAAAGPSIRAYGHLGEVSLLDFPPTFLSLMGEPLPQKLTGRVLKAMVRD
jgi:PUA-like domain